MGGWADIRNVESKAFRCGYCGLNVANDRGFANKFGYSLLICPNCDKPTYIERGQQTPSPIPGNEVNHLPEDLKALYREARSCCGVSAFTASVLACRKLLMNIAVSQGADEGLRFIEYVNYLADRG